jgi:hypothetical protein
MSRERFAIDAPTRFIDTGLERYAYRRFGKTGRFPPLFLRHFTGTLDNCERVLSPRSWTRS